MGEILIVEDEVVLARTIVTFLDRQGFTASHVQSTTTAKEAFQRILPKLSIVDYKLAYDDGLELLAWMREINPNSHVVMMTGHGDIDLAVRAMKAGARDFICKPVPLKMFADLAKNLMLNESSSSNPTGGERIIGRSGVAVNLRQSIHKLAQFSVDGNPPSVLIMGPKGTGKSMVAVALHESTRRPRDAFVTLDCSLHNDIGKEPLLTAFSQAVSGTLLIRHVDNMSSELQAFLLQLLSDNDAQSNQPWIISTTTERFLGETRLSEFRTDLLYRLQIGWLEIPPLVERTNDILPIAEFIARQYALKYNKPEPRYTPEARIKLLEYDWPGNVSEMANCIERSILSAISGVIDDTDLKMTRSHHTQDPVIPKLSQLETHTLERALAVSKGNVSKAARLLGITRDTLRYKMQKLGLTRR